MAKKKTNLSRVIPRLLSYIILRHKLIFGIVVICILISSCTVVASSLVLEILIDNYIEPLLLSLIHISHELKTPLTSISGYAEIMKNGMVRPEDIPIFSERIYKEARRLITLVEDIIKLSKLDEESVEL